MQTLSVRSRRNLQELSVLFLCVSLSVLLAFDIVRKRRHYTEKRKQSAIAVANAKTFSTSVISISLTLPLTIRQKRFAQRRRTSTLWYDLRKKKRQEETDAVLECFLKCVTTSIISILRLYKSRKGRGFFGRRQLCVRNVFGKA